MVNELFNVMVFIEENFEFFLFSIVYFYFKRLK